ncbi:MAG: hypothetical protein AAGD18_11390 [Actinomycetota bacterium]
MTPTVIVASGHLTDAPDRPQPRFPESEVGRVELDIARILDSWGVGEGTTLITGGARGADLICAEGALERGGGVVLVLAEDVDSFVRRSVDGSDPSWRDRFDAARRRASEVHVLDPASSDPGVGMHDAANRRMIELARDASGEAGPRAIVVWNGEEGDGPGGTRDFLRRMGVTGPGERVAIVDPTPRR